jgi:WD40 repeat protein
MSSGKELSSLTYNSDIPQDIRFSPDGTMIAACGLNSAMRIWGLPNSKASQPTATWSHPTPTVQPADAPVIQKSSQLDLRLGAKQLIWPGDNQVLIGGYGILAYDPTNDSNTPIGEEQWITSMSVSPDGKTLAIAEYEAIKLFSLDGQGGKTLGKGGDNTKLAFSPDGKTLAASVNQAIKLYDVASGTDLATIPIQASWMQDIAFSPDGKSLVIVSANDVSVWDIASGSQSKSFSEHVQSPKTIAFSPDGKILAVGGSDEGNVGKIVLWDFADGQWLRTLTGHKNTVNTMVFSPDGRWLASGSADLTIRLWDVAGGNLLNTLTGHTTSVNTVAFSPNGKMLVSAGDDAVIFWKITPGE